ncbi:ecdysteroid 22-kinase family protein [bacterium]|nr:ecdysteroid 22-kinase family protein [bacterium]
MSKRPRVHFASQGSTKRSRKQCFKSPFGFNVTAYSNLIVKPCPLGAVTHQLTNTILRFRDGEPAFSEPNKVFEVDKVEGLYVRLKGVSERILVSSCHTNHTVSIYKLAHEILAILHSRPRVRLVKGQRANPLEVDMRTAIATERGHSEEQVWLNARFEGKTVVLKTTTKLDSMLRYVLEAMIHETIMRRRPCYVPMLHFVAFEQVARGEKNRLILCSEQLRRKSVFSWIHSMRSFHPRKDDLNVRLWKMLNRVCQCLRTLQESVSFSHRDCHCNNVYYDDDNRRPDHVKFIDFDWSSILFNGQRLSVPRHLFDSARPKYAKNKSIDLCIFLRTIGPALRKPVSLQSKTQFTEKDMVDIRKWDEFECRTEMFYNNIWKPLMKRYERETEAFLRAEAKDSTVAMQLFKLNLGPKRTFGHIHGLRNLIKKNPKQGVELDYRLGYYEWSSMTPRAILNFLDTHRFTY